MFPAVPCNLHRLSPWSLPSWSRKTNQGCTDPRLLDSHRDCSWTFSSCLPESKTSVPVTSNVLPSPGSCLRNSKSHWGMKCKQQVCLKMDEYVNEGWGALWKHSFSPPVQILLSTELQRNGTFQFPFWGPQQAGAIYNPQVPALRQLLLRAVWLLTCTGIWLCQRSQVPAKTWQHSHLPDDPQSKFSESFHQ